MDADVSDALIRLHETDFLNDGISKRYPRIEKVSLGCLIYGSEQANTHFRGEYDVARKSWFFFHPSSNPGLHSTLQWRR